MENFGERERRERLEAARGKLHATLTETKITKWRREKNKRNEKRRRAREQQQKTRWENNHQLECCSLVRWLCFPSYRCHLPSNFLMLSDRFFVYCNQLKWKSLLHWRKHKCYFFFAEPKKSNLSSSRAFGVNITQKIWRRFSYISAPKANKRTPQPPSFYLSRKWQFNYM